MIRVTAQKHFIVNAFELSLAIFNLNLESMLPCVLVFKFENILDLCSNYNWLLHFITTNTSIRMFSKMLLLRWPELNYNSSCHTLEHICCFILLMMEIYCTSLIDFLKSSISPRVAASIIFSFLVVQNYVSFQALMFDMIKYNISLFWYNN